MVSCLVRMLGKIVLALNPKEMAAKRHKIHEYLCLLCLFVAVPFQALAHEIPADITIQAFLKPEGRRLYFLVRVPLSAMRDIDFPRRGPGYLDLDRGDPYLRDAAEQWIANFTEIREGNTRLVKPSIVDARVSQPSDKSFASYDEAAVHVAGAPLANGTDLYLEQALLDVLFEYPIQSDRSDFSIHPGFEPLGLRVITVLRFMPPTGVIRAFEFAGDPGLVRLDPRWHQAALRFVQMGFFHILDGTDHLLFLFCLIIPFRRLRTLIAIVTSFTVAHSITLIASAFELGPGALWFPPLIETLIAVSIFYMALENIAGGNASRRWMLTFGFGLVHGFGFSFALRHTLQFAGSHLLTSLLSFNLGVELGQLLVLLLLLPTLGFLFKHVVAERLGTIILSTMVAHTAWHWMAERFDTLRQFQFAWRVPTAGFLFPVVGWLILILLLAVLVWLVRFYRAGAGSKKADAVRSAGRPV